ncbi:conserved Plasmodium protein, unknown function [Plasmodium berghei]|uniref:Hpc2-related domain-containing protein n=1 Tax=Plasmodium berghei TaxID=5821 RepID=A0A1D3LWW8_PLABE|nr:conserved Plasmodium protein, unknown function [Plasmodium berghei]
MDTIEKSKRKENEIDDHYKNETQKKNSETYSMQINDEKKNNEINNFSKVENSLDIYGIANVNKNEMAMYNNFETIGSTSTTNNNGNNLIMRKNNEHNEGKKIFGVENKSSYETEDDILLNDETNLSDEEVEDENVREKDLILQRYKHGTSIYIDILFIENDKKKKKKNPCVVIDFYSECLNKYKSECSFVYYQNYNSISNVIINENVDVGNLNTSTNTLIENFENLNTGNNINYSIEENINNLNLGDEQNVNGKNKIIPKIVTNQLISNNTGINCGSSSILPYDDFKNFDLQKKKQESLDPLLKCINSLSDRINLQHLVGDPTSYFKLGGGDMFYDINDPFLDDEEMYKELNKTKNEIILTRQIEDEYSVWSADISDDYVEINPNYFFSFYSSKCKYIYESDNEEIDEINIEKSESSDNENYKNVLNSSSSQCLNENIKEVYIINNDISNNEKKNDDFMIYSSEEDICESSSDEENGNNEKESDFSEEEIIFNPFAWKKFEKHIPLEFISYFENLEKELDALPIEVDISDIQKIIKIYIHKIFVHIMKKHKKTLNHFNMLLDDFIEIDIKQLRWLTTIINKTSNSLNDIDICRIWFEHIFSYNTKLFVNYEKEFITKIKTSQIFEKNNKLHLNNILKDISLWKVYHDNMEKNSKENVDVDSININVNGKNGSIHFKNSQSSLKELDNKKKIENGVNTLDDKYLKNEKNNFINSKNGNDNGLKKIAGHMSTHNIIESNKGDKKMFYGNNSISNTDLIKSGNEENFGKNGNQNISEINNITNNGSQKIDESDKIKGNDKNGEKEQDVNKINNINNNYKENYKLIEKYFKRFENISHDILNYIKIFNKQKCFLKDMISAGFDVLVEKNNKYFGKLPHIALSDILTSLFNFRYKTNVIINYDYIEALINFYQEKYKIDISYDKGKNKKVFLFDTVEMSKLNLIFYKNKNILNDKMALNNSDHDKKENYKMKEFHDGKNMNNGNSNFKHFGTNTNDILEKNNKYNLTFKNEFKNVHTLNNSNNLINKRKIHESNKHNNIKEVNYNINTKKKNIDNHDNNNQKKGLSSARIVICSDNEIENISSKHFPIKNNLKNITTFIENITKKKNNHTCDNNHRKNCNNNNNVSKQNGSIFNLKKVRDVTNACAKSSRTIMSNISVKNPNKNNMHCNYNSNYIESEYPNIIKFSKQKNIFNNEKMFIISDGNNSILNSSNNFNDKTNLYKKRKIKDAYISNKNNNVAITKFDQISEKIKTTNVDDKSGIRRCITVDSSEENGN